MQYDRRFFSFVDKTAHDAASVVVPMLLEHFPIHSVADFGCGLGTWLAVWKEQGVFDVFGVDGYAEIDQLLIDVSEFHAGDLNRPLDLNRRFDLVQSLEVAEHLSPSASADFVNTLTRHGEIVLFSAAKPGQGRLHHTNERPLAYWRSLFAERGYRLHDLVRPRIAARRELASWYRCNILLFVSEQYAHHPPCDYVAPDAEIADFTVWRDRLARRLVRLLPVPVVDRLARIDMAIRQFRHRRTAVDEASSAPDNSR